MKRYWVYMLTTERNGTLYVGVSSNIAQRAYEHKQGNVKGFTQKYCIKRLVYAEEFDNPDAAHAREKTLKKWHRRWKLELIESMNPEWNDLYEFLA